MDLRYAPTVLVSDLKTIYEASPDTLIPTNQHIKTKPARFLVFPQRDKGYVLRDYRADTDYPFHTKPAAIGGMELRLGGAQFLGSPIHIDAYGEALEAFEVFA